MFLGKHAFSFRLQAKTCIPLSEWSRIPFYQLSVLFHFPANTIVAICLSTADIVRQDICTYRLMLHEYAKLHSNHPCSSMSSRLGMLAVLARQRLNDLTRVTRRRSVVPQDTVPRDLQPGGSRLVGEFACGDPGAAVSIYRKRSCHRERSTSVLSEDS